MAGSITEVQSHDKSKGGRSLAGVYGSATGVQSQSVPKGMENIWAQKCNGGMASRFIRMYGLFLGMTM